MTDDDFICIVTAALVDRIVVLKPLIRTVLKLHVFCGYRLLTRPISVLRFV